VRPIAVAFSAMTLGEAVVLFSMPPRGSMVPIEIHWEWGFFAAGLASLAAALVSVFLGGSLPPLPNVPLDSSASEGRTLH
jgi:hypothetical protein